MKKKVTKWKDEFYVRAYRFARDGASDTEIAGRLGYDPTHFIKLMRSNEALRNSIAEGRDGTGRKAKGGYYSFKEFSYGRLPPELMELWDQLESIDKPDGKDRNEVLDIIAAKSRRIQQHLFLHALISCNFMHTVALTKLGLRADTLQNWTRQDPEFDRLIKGIHEMKKDFFESHFIELVKRGDSAATIFAVKSMCRSRGYSDKVQIEMKQEVTHTHNVSLNDLPVEAQRAYLEALRRKRQEQLPGPVEDAEYE